MLPPSSCVCDGERGSVCVCDGGMGGGVSEPASVRVPLEAGLCACFGEGGPRVVLRGALRSLRYSFLNMDAEGLLGILLSLVFFFFNLLCQVQHKLSELGLVLNPPSCLMVTCSFAHTVGHAVQFVFMSCWA